jgi:hypothetical protein
LNDLEKQRISTRLEEIFQPINEKTGLYLGEQLLRNVKIF